MPFSEWYSIAVAALPGRLKVNANALWPSSGSPRHCRRGPSASSSDRRARQSCLPPLPRYQYSRLVAGGCYDRPVCCHHRLSVSSKSAVFSASGSRLARFTAVSERFCEGLVDGTYNKSLQRTKPPASRSAWPLNSSRYTYRYLLW